MVWSHPHPGEFAAAVGLGLIGLVLLARRLARSTDARSLTLAGLRAASLVLLVMILLDPVRTVETRIPGERPNAVFLVDGSRSMSLERPSSRLDQVVHQIDRALASVPPDRMPNLERFRFGRRLAAVSPGGAMEATDDESRLVDALERLPSRFGATLPVGVFVFSDGREPTSPALDEVASGYRKLGVPIHVLPVGDVKVSGDVSIRDLVVPRDAPKGSKVAVKVVVGTRGFAGSRAEVSIRPATGVDVRPLASLPLTLVDGDLPVELVIEADRARSPLVVEVSPLPGEAVAENNSIPFRIASRNSRIRVIYMEGTVEPEYAFIRDALLENPDIECVTMAVDYQSNITPRLHRIDDPSKAYPTTREELLGYDVVICSDISRAAFTPEQIAWTVELVAKRGGGFAMVGGNTSFGSGGWDRTAWDGMIPIDMSGDGPGRGSQFFNGSFRVVVPPGAEDHPIWRIVDDPARNRAILDRMPPFSGTNLTDRLKPAATLLGISDRPLEGMVYGPQRARRQDRPSDRKAGGNPIFSAQTFGRGRSFAMSTDSTVSWGAEFERDWGEGDNRYFRKFWRNVVTWLAENSLASSRNLEIATDKIIYRPGQSIVVSGRAFDDKLDPTDRYRLVARMVRPGAARPDTAAIVPDTPMTARGDSRDYAATLAVPPAESIRRVDGQGLQKALIEVEALEGDRTVARASLEVQVLDDSEEFHDPRPDPGRLRTLATLTGGTIMSDSADLGRILDRPLDVKDRVMTARSPVWDSPIFLGLIFALLVAEWTLRRRKGLA